MNTQCNTSVSSTNPNVYPTLYRRNSAAPSRRRKIVSDDALNDTVFEQFLCWLGPDAETAGRKYESIRSRLIMMFKARRCVFAEDLADATIERVAQKLGARSIGFTGDPALYFYGVAKKIYLEYQRKTALDHRRIQSSPPPKVDDPDMEYKLKRLDEALNTISESDRELILRYYSGTGKSKINHRRALAEQFRIGPNALRLRVFRIRKEIKNYMLVQAQLLLERQNQIACRRHCFDLPDVISDTR